MIDAALLEAIKTPDPSSDEIVSILDKASRWWLNGERDLSEDVEIVIRLLVRTEEFEDILPGSKFILDALTREAGLYPYMEGGQLVRDEIALEADRVPGLDNIVFHSE